MTAKTVKAWLFSLILLMPIFAQTPNASAGAEDDQKRHSEASVDPKPIGTSSASRNGEDTERIDRTLAFPQRGTLEVHNFSGDVRIIGTKGKDVEIHAIRRAKRELLDHITFDVRTSNATVVIETNKREQGWNHGNDNVVETSLEIKVPAAAKLDIDVFSSNLDIKGISGAQRLKTFSGNIAVDAASAGPTPHLVAETFSGGIRARLADSVKGEVNFSSFSGSFESELPLTARLAKRERTTEPGSGSASESTLTFKTFSGRVHVVK